MCCLFKRIIAVLLVAALFVTSLAACNKDETARSNDSSSDEESPALSADSEQSLSSAEGSSQLNSGDTTEDGGFLSSDDEPSYESSEQSSGTDSSTTHEESSQVGGNSSADSSEVEDSYESREDTEPSESEENSSDESVEDSSSKPVEDSSSKPVEDSSSKPVEDSSSGPVEDSSSGPVDSSSSAPVDSSSSVPVESVEIPEESEESEEIIPEEPADPYDPINPLPPTLYPDAVDSFFNDSVFVGYSIMMHFGRYVSEWRSEIDSSIMGDAVFCAGVGISFYSDRTGSSLPMYRGKEYNFKDLPAATGSNTIYIGLMGYSDLKRSSSSSNCVEYAYNETVQGLQRIKSANPNVSIVVLANTYNTGSYIGLTSSRHNNTKIREYNNLVLDYCTANGIDFVDVATPLTDHRGYFVTEYSSDESYHIIKEAYYLWMRALREYAAKKQNGTWQNMADMPPLPAV